MVDSAADRVLNVNDDDATRYFTTKILKKAGFEVIEAINGRQALDLVAVERPALVLLDVKLPDLSGLEVCRLIKDNPLTQTVLVVQTSATFPTSERRVAGLDSGADAYVPQPFEPAELVAVLRAALRTRKAEMSERRTSRRLQRTFAAIAEPLLFVDAKGKVELVNEAAAQFQRDGEPLLGRPAVDVLAPFVGRDAVVDLLRVGSPRRRELETTIHERTVHVTADPIVDDAGHVEGTVLILHDISDRRRLEREQRVRAEELALSNRRKDEFLAMLAHELRNPLNAISVANTLLESRLAEDGAGVRLCSTIHRQTANLARMVDDLLEVSRITRGLIQLRRESTDLLDAVRQAIHSCTQAMSARNQTLELDLPAGPVIIDGDALRLEQIVANLLVNASKYSEPKSTVTLAVRPVEDRLVELTVKDHGAGISSDMLAAVFEPFVQAQQALSRSLGGLGIGLTMVQNLVRLHGGSVEASSAGVGMGSTFTVRLPLSVARMPEGAVAHGSHEVEEAAPPLALDILVVEDNVDTRELVELWLTNQGHRVTTSADGKTGLAMAEAIRPHIALVDIGLPGLDGYEVAKRLRSSGVAETFLVAVSGYGRDEDRSRALECGFDLYLVKPIDDRAIRTVLAQHHRRRNVAPPSSSRRAEAPG